MPLGRARARLGTQQREPQESAPGRQLRRALESECYESLSNSTSINSFRMKSRLSSKKVSGTELLLQLWYNTDVLPFFTYSVFA